MKKIIIYGSNYGTTKQYADYLSQKTNISCIDYKQVKTLTSYDTVIYLGGLYAGGILGLSKTVKLLPKNTNLIIATVGLSNPCDKVNIKHIKDSIKKQIPPDIYTEAIIYHLRGGIDYKNLTYKHKILMRLLYNQVKNIPPEKQTTEQQGIIATYNKKVNFINYKSLDPLIEQIKKY